MFAIGGKVSLVAALFATCSVTLARSAAIPGGRLLLMAAAAIRKQEQAVRTIRFAFRGSSTIRMGLKTKLVESGSSRGVATLDGMPRGKCRFEVFRELDGPTAPFYARAYATAYNGRVGTMLQTMGGTPKKWWPVDRAQVGGKLPSDASELFMDTGWKDTVFGFTSTLPYKSAHPRFSAFITKPGQKRTVLRARWAQMGGKRYLRVTHISPLPRSGGRPSLKDVFMLDPRRAFALAAYDEYYPVMKRDHAGRPYVVPGPQMICRVRVRGYCEPARGVFFPRRIDFKGFFRNGEVCQTALTAISKVVVDDPKVNARTWIISFPRGTAVKDLATGRVIRIGGTPAQQLKEIEAAVKAAQ